jgi:hypothetical protein
VVDLVHELGRQLDGLAVLIVKTAETTPASSKRVRNSTMTFCVRLLMTAYGSAQPPLKSPDYRQVLHYPVRLHPFPWIIT